jgi:amino acid transporter
MINMGETKTESKITVNELVKSIDWKQGLIIAMGVPILILPSLYDLAEPLYAFGIVIWGISCVQGFLQNFAIGEMSVTFQASGVPGCAQKVFTEENADPNKFNKGKFIGAFCAWNYWFTWSAVIPVFSILAAGYVAALFGMETNMVINIVVSLAIYLLIFLIGLRGLASGAKLGTILAAITIIPLVVIAVIPFFNGDFSMSNITDQFLPPMFDKFGGMDAMFLFGTLAIAQWSACGWETTAVYGPEYKNPGKDLPKAMIACGLICLFVYVLVATSVFGVLGVDGVLDNGYMTFIPICESAFGHYGMYIAILLLVAGLIMIIQTAFLGTSRTMYTMAKEDNMPRFFGTTNVYGAPVSAMVFQFIFGMCLVPLGSPGMILAASSIGFCLANGIAMLAFIKSRLDPRFKNLERPWKCPRGWLGIAIGMAFFQICLLVPGLTYYSYILYGIEGVIVGYAILLIYIPFYFVLQRYYKNREKQEMVEEKTSNDDSGPQV